MALIEELLMLLWGFPTRARRPPRVIFERGVRLGRL
jgi:hypothetical protein